MAVDFASLVLAVDSTQVKKGAVSLDEMTAAGARAEQQVKRMTAQQFRAVQAVEAFARATNGLQARTAGATAAGAAMARTATGMGQASGLARHHLQNLTFQVNDLVTSLATGQAPMRVFMQQGAQIAQIGQQAGIGLGGMVRAVLRMVAPFAGLAAIAGIAATALMGVKRAAADDAEMQQFARTLGLTKDEIKDLEDVTVTWGDTFGATMDVILERGGTSASGVSSAWQMALEQIGEFGKFSVAVLAGAFAALVRFVGATAQNIGVLIAKGIEWGVNKALEFIETLINGVATGLNKVSAFLGSMGINVGTVGTVKLGRVAATGSFTSPFADAGAQFNQTFGDVMSGFDSISARASQRARSRLKEQAEEMIEDRPDKKGKAGKKPPKAKEDAVAKEIAQIEQQIAALYRLADAYLASDEAALKAEAMSRAEEKALRLKTDASKFYALELEALAAQRAADGAKQVAELRFEADARQKVNDMVAAGVIPAEQAGQALQLETALRPLVAAAAGAEGDAKEMLLAIIQQLTDATGRLNEQIARENALRQIAANDNDIARLRLETELIGANNRERATRLAQLQAEQYIRDNNLGGAEADRFLQSALAKANAQVDYDEALKRFNDLQAAADSFASAITDVIMGTKSLGEAFADMARQIIADIIQMTIRMLIFRAISGLFRGSGASVGIDPVTGEDFLFSAKGNVFSHGNVVPFASGGVVSMPTLFPMAGGRTGLMGEAGPEAIMPLARDSRGRLGVRANDNSPGVIEVRIIADASPDLLIKTAVVADSRIRVAAPQIIRQAANTTLRAAQRPKLMGRG